MLTTSRIASAAFCARREVMACLAGSEGPGHLLDLVGFQHVTFLQVVESGQPHSAFQTFSNLFDIVLLSFVILVSLFLLSLLEQKLCRSYRTRPDVWYNRLCLSYSERYSLDLLADQAGWDSHELSKALRG